MGEAGRILVWQEIGELIRRGTVRSSPGVEAGQVQPASLDLTVGKRAWRVRTGFLSGKERVAARLEELSLFELDLSRGAVLERGHPYILEVREKLSLPAGLKARCNPRSSTGRLDIFVRVLADRCPRFDEVPEGYKGPLYLEVVPRSFSVRLWEGLSLNQVRFFTGEPRLTDQELRERASQDPLALDGRGRPLGPEELDVEEGLILRVSLEADPGGPPVVGYRARRFSGLVDLAGRGAHRKEDFWEAIPPPPGGRMILEPEVFYILASLEKVRVPPDLAAEMLPFDVGLGELRTNYAGFFDNGFGPARAVLEVRAHDAPFLVEHGQALFKMQYFRTATIPEHLYGDPALGSHYQEQGLALSRHFTQ